MKIFLRSRNYFIKEILAFLFLLLAIYFFRKQKDELVQAVDLVQQAVPSYVFLGIVFTGIYILCQGMMYVYSFRAVHSKISIGAGVKLFLKRNLVSVFLPGGGITSLAFFTSDIENQGISKARIGFASYIYGLIGIASLVVLAIPVLLYLGLERGTNLDTWYALGALMVLVCILIYATYSFLKRGWVFRRLVSISPQFSNVLEEIQEGHFSSSAVIYSLFWSFAIEACGILHVYIAMLAIGIEPGWEQCIAAYTIATLFFAISPFLRGLGAVEVSMVVALRTYGIQAVDAISITVLFRVFEFWLPLVAGIASFGSAKGNILLRILPAALLAFLGILNIISVLTPPLAERIHLLANFLPMGAIYFSNSAILVVGVLLLICAAFLIRGFRNAWRLALILCVLSLIGNMLKAIDYEEAIVAFVAITVLVITRRSYRLKSDPKIVSFSIQSSLIILFSVLVYGIVGFYFLDKRDFGVDFSFYQSLGSTLRSFVLLEPEPVPITRFAKSFVLSINLLGVISLGLLLYAFIRPYIFQAPRLEEEQQKAKALVQRYGSSADDYFKGYFDKIFYFGLAVDGFIAYKISSGFALILGEPICPADPASKLLILREFEKFCLTNGLKTSYYKVDSLSLPIFYELGKKSLPIGQEAIVDLLEFKLEGKDRKSLRNALNALEKKGFQTVVYQGPIKDGLLQKLKHVSDEWLDMMNRKEILFSSGMFDWEELKNQDIITIENEDEKVVAFLNIIPDFAKGEGTYDLIRKTKDAPGGVMDALIVRLISLLKERGMVRLNMGMASMSGIERPKDVPEWAIKFAYERLRFFKHYHGIYEFKNKFNPQWSTKYLVYENHYDLTSIPKALNKVMRDLPNREE